MKAKTISARQPHVAGEVRSVFLQYGQTYALTGICIAHFGQARVAPAGASGGDAMGGGGGGGGGGGETLEMGLSPFAGDGVRYRSATPLTSALMQMYEQRAPGERRREERRRRPQAGISDAGRLAPLAAERYRWAAKSNEDIT
jgi:hypothetical protein